MPSFATISLTAQFSSSRNRQTLAASMFKRSRGFPQALLPPEGEQLPTHSRGLREGVVRHPPIHNSLNPSTAPEEAQKYVFSKLMGFPPMTPRLLSHFGTIGGTIPPTIPLVSCLGRYLSKPQAASRSSMSAQNPKAFQRLTRHSKTLPTSSTTVLCVFLYRRKFTEESRLGVTQSHSITPIEGCEMA
ncbi:hypothetical protein F5Y11DRAFT_182372 [Daldinia sp. FL1419]|nr:hypothetical protein F5Y11DRAFT_182372 [Daldinia sp. FL1419]